MAVPSIVKQTSASDNNAVNQLTITTPASLTTGNYLLAVLTHDGSDGSGQQFEAVTGWTLHGSAGNSASDNRLAIYTREVDGTEAANYTFTWPDTAVRTAGMILEIQDTDGMDVFGTFTMGAGITVMCSGVTTTVDDCLVMISAGWDGGDGVPFSDPSGYTKQYEVQSTTSGTGASCTIQTKNVAPSAGLVSGVSIGGASSDGNTGVMFAMAPGGGGGGGGPVFTPRAIVY